MGVSGKFLQIILTLTEVFRLMLAFLHRANDYSMIVCCSKTGKIYFTIRMRAVFRSFKTKTCKMQVENVFLNEELTLLQGLKLFLRFSHKLFTMFYCEIFSKIYLRF